jgi:DNA-binding transcriptional regulator GbsR (MarR family)
MSGGNHERQKGRNRETVRQSSKRLFGNRDTVDVLCAIAASNGAVCAADLEEELGLANNRVRAQLIALADVGLLQKLPKGRERIQWYQRIESPMWAAVLSLADDWSRSSTTP